MTARFLLPFMICLVSFLSYIGGTVYIAALPELSQTFQVPSSYIKFTITIYYIGIMLGTLLAGPFSEMISRRKTLLFFILLSCMASLLCGISESIPFFLTGRLLQGIGNAGESVLVMALVANRFEGVVYRKIMFFVLIMISLGPGLSPLYGSVILEFFDWRLLFFILGFFQLVAFGLALFIEMERKEIQLKFKETVQEYIFFMKHPTFRYYCLIIGSLYGGFSMFMVISPYIFRLDYGWGILDFAWIGLAFAFANSLGSYLNKLLTDEILGKNILLIGLSLIGTVVFILFLMKLPTNGLWIMYVISLFVIGDSITSSFLITDAMKLGVSYANIAASLVSLSKGVLTSVVLVIIPFLPSTLTVIKVIFLLTFLLCAFGYLKIYKTV